MLKTLASVLALLILALALACTAPVPTLIPSPTPVPTATPDIPATVAARAAAIPTATPYPTATPWPTATPRPTATPYPTATPRPTHTLYPTPTPRPTHTPYPPTVLPTATPYPRATRYPTSTPYPTPTATPLPPLKYPRHLLLFGPESGVIDHEPNDGFVEEFRGLYTGEDALVEATIYNPYASRNSNWEHGFLLRNSGGNYLHWVSIDSDGDWWHFHRLGESKSLDRTIKRSSDINTAPGGKNHLAVVLIGATGRLYINGKFQSNLDFSAITGDGWIKVFTDDDLAGSTRFEDFTVWRWDGELVRRNPELRAR